MQQSILYGNGINRLTEGMPSWDQLIKDVSDVTLDKNIPNPLKYEALLMKKPYRGRDRLLISNDGSKVIATNDGKPIVAKGELTERTLKEGIAKRLKSFGTNDIYDSIAKLPVNHFITTNYDNSLFDSLGEGALDKRFREEQIYSIRRNYLIKTVDGATKHYWPRHGNIDSPASIMLGFDHYCGSLAKIETYVKGGYDLHGSRLESMYKRLTQGIDDVISWVDLFFISNDHIIGLNLGYEETDLWWVFNKRRRIKQAEPNLIRNIIYYYPVEHMKADVQQLLTSFDVSVIKLDNGTLENPSFIKRYSAQMSKLRDKIETKA